MFLDHLWEFFLRSYAKSIWLSLVKLLVLPVHFLTFASSLLAEVVWLSWPMRKRTLASPVHHKFTSLTFTLTLVFWSVSLYLYVGVRLRKPASVWWCVCCGCVECVQFVGVLVRSAVRVRFACALVLIFRGGWDSSHCLGLFSLSSHCSKKLKTFFRSLNVFLELILGSLQTWFPRTSGSVWRN